MDKIKLTIWIFVFVILVNSSLAAEISGVVRDDEGQPLYNVGIAVREQGSDELITGTVTDLNGEFIIPDLDQGVYELTFSYFSSEKKLITSTDSDSIDLSLTPLVELEPIIISAQRPKLQPIIELITSTNIYGNSQISTSQSLQTNYESSITISGTKSTYDNGRVFPQYMEWYIGVPKQSFDNILRASNDYDFLENILNLLTFHNQDLTIIDSEEFDFQLPETLPTGQYYIILKINSPNNPFGEFEITWHQFNLLSSEQTPNEITFEEVGTQGPYSGTADPSSFPSCDQPQPVGTICYNGRLAPPLISSWSSQESDGFEGNPSYNSPLIPSTCSVNGEVRARDTCGCLIDGVFTFDCPRFTHVAEYSSSNNCEEPVEILECPTETLC
ncbi:MAG: carboxypeptidase-like regulatory domain-containing protein, partial [Nanoarchaeota archaeon]|nr:carboxypeptidase-like regulatory domain-containing protein [Nanoarchaeota archaeon]